MGQGCHLWIDCRFPDLLHLFVQEITLITVYEINGHDVLYSLGASRNTSRGRPTGSRVFPGFMIFLLSRYDHSPWGWTLSMIFPVMALLTDFGNRDGFVGVL